MTKIRGFELVSGFTDTELLPKRETAHAAGYDLSVAEETSIAPGEIVLVPTGVRLICKMVRCFISMIALAIPVKRLGADQFCWCY